MIMDTKSLYCLAALQSSALMFLIFSTKENCKKKTAEHVTKMVLTCRSRRDKKTRVTGSGAVVVDEE
jgi:hypothetical protein